MTKHDNDPFEEFKFKPLTEGLGFHRQGTTNTLKKPSDLPKNLFNSNELSLIEEDLNPLKSPVPRKIEKPTRDNSKLSPSSQVVDDILKTLQQNKQTAAALPKAKAEIKQTSTVLTYTKDTPSLSAFFLDALLVAAASLLCFILLLVVTQVDLIANFMNPDTQGQIYMSSLSVVLGVSFIYYLVNRAFLGQTPGEWAYDQRLGRPEEMTTASYIPRLAARWALVTLTGGITLPLISKILGRDLVGEWLDIPLLHQN